MTVPNKETVGNSPAIGTAAPPAWLFQHPLHFQGSCLPKMFRLKHTRCREKLGCKGALKRLRFDHCSKTCYEFRTASPLQGQCKSEWSLAKLIRASSGLKPVLQLQSQLVLSILHTPAHTRALLPQPLMPCVPIPGTHQAEANME